MSIFISFLQKKRIKERHSGYLLYPALTATKMARVTALYHCGSWRFGAARTERIFTHANYLLC